MKAPPGPPLAIVALSLGLAGCFTWTPFDPGEPLSPSTTLPNHLRATLTDTSRVDLTTPFVRADTLYGRSASKRDTVALAVTDVRRLERERFSPWRTLGISVGVPAAALVAVYAVVCGGGECRPTY